MEARTPGIGVPLERCPQRFKLGDERRATGSVPHDQSRFPNASVAKLTRQDRRQSMVGAHRAASREARSHLGTLPESLEMSAAAELRVMTGRKRTIPSTRRLDSRRFSAGARSKSSFNLLIWDLAGVERERENALSTHSFRQARISNVDCRPEAGSNLLRDLNIVASESVDNSRDRRGSTL